jgi:hypothetical protein
MSDAAGAPVDARCARACARTARTRFKGLAANDSRCDRPDLLGNATGTSVAREGPAPCP